MNSQTPNNNKVHALYSIVFILSGAASCVGALTLVNLVSHTKYVCDDSKDTYIVWLKAIEWLLVVLSFTLSALLITQKQVGIKVAVAFAGVSVLFGILLMGMHEQTVCSDCLRNDVARAAITSGTSDEYKTQVRTMLGLSGTSALPVQVNNPVWFKTPENYCTSALTAIPGVTDDFSLSHAETCLVWACASNFVSHAGTQFAMTVSGFFCLVVASFLIIYVEQSHPSAAVMPAIDAAKILNGDQTSKISPVPLTNAQLFNRNKTTPPYRYKRVAEDFHF